MCFRHVKSALFLHIGLELMSSAPEPRLPTPHAQWICRHVLLAEHKAWLGLRACKEREAWAKVHAQAPRRPGRRRPLPSGGKGPGPVAHGPLIEDHRVEEWVFPQHQQQHVPLGRGRQHARPQGPETIMKTRSVGNPFRFPVHRKKKNEEGVFHSFAKPRHRVERAPWLSAGCST